MRVKWTTYATEDLIAIQDQIAAVNGIQYLMTWNFQHIANAETRATIEQVCRDCGYLPPLICTPDKLLGT